MSARIPLAWLQLTRDKKRLAAALAGVAFAVVLMLTQLGLEDALVASAATFHSHLTGDLFMIHPKYQNIIYSRTFTERRLYQALGFDGVESIAPLYVGVVPIMNPFDRTEHRIFIIGFDPQSAVLNAPGIAENLQKLRTPGKVLFDSLRRPEFGRVAEVFHETGPVTTEAAGHGLEVVGVFQLGTSFGADGNLVMSDETLLSLLPYRQRGLIDVGIIRLKPGVDPQQAREAISRILEPDVRLLTRREFIEMERDYWVTYTAIGFIFKFGTLVGILIGCIIVYQILYSDVTDHLAEYATLKAIGYPDSFLYRVVLTESLILSIFGFFPGILIALFIFTVSRNATFLPIEMSLSRVTTVYVLTALMCAISGALAIRRLKSADPADVF